MMMMMLAVVSVSASLQLYGVQLWLNNLNECVEEEKQTVNKWKKSTYPGICHTTDGVQYYIAAS